MAKTHREQVDALVLLKEAQFTTRLFPKTPSLFGLFVAGSLVFVLPLAFILKLIVFLGHLGWPRFSIGINAFRGSVTVSAGLAEHSSSWTSIFVFK